jgi:hypothetical protein
MPIEQQTLNRIKNNDATLTDINLMKQDLTSDDILNLVSALRGNTCVTAINLHGDSIGGADAIMFEKISEIIQLREQRQQLEEENKQLRRRLLLEEKDEKKAESSSKAGKTHVHPAGIGCSIFIGESNANSSMPSSSPGKSNESQQTTGGMSFKTCAML